VQKVVRKTNTVKIFVKASYDLNNPLHYEVLPSSSNILLKDMPPVLIDEWQKLLSILKIFKKSNG
jgi:hypothetical protein